MGRLVCGVLLVAVLGTIGLNAPALAAPCSADAVQEMQTAAHLWKEYRAYKEENEDTLAQAELKNIEHQVVMGKNDGAAECGDRRVRARFWLSLAHINQERAGSKWVDESIRFAIGDSQDASTAVKKAKAEVVGPVKDALDHAQREGAAQFFPDEYQTAVAEYKQLAASH